MPQQVRLDDDVVRALDAEGSLSKAANLALRAHFSLPPKVKRKRRAPSATDATSRENRETPIAAPQAPPTTIPARRVAGVAHVPAIRGSGVRVARRSR